MPGGGGTETKAPGSVTSGRKSSAVNPRVKEGRVVNGLCDYTLLQRVRLSACDRFWLPTLQTARDGSNDLLKC